MKHHDTPTECDRSGSLAFAMFGMRMPPSRCKGSGGPPGSSDKSELTKAVELINEALG